MDEIKMVTARVRIGSQEWTPSKQGCLGFDMVIHEVIGELANVVLAGQPLNAHPSKGPPRLVSRYDSVKLRDPVTIEGRGVFPEGFDVVGTAQREGISIWDIQPEAEVTAEMIDPEIAEMIERGKGVEESFKHVKMPDPPFREDVSYTAHVLKALLEVAAMDQAPGSVSAFCLEAAEKIAADGMKRLQEEEEKEDANRP